MYMTINQTALKLPFRGDHVGSLLRPERLHVARKEYKNGNVTAEDLRKVENEEIRDVVDKQIDAGLSAVTDGEFRRTWFHLDFMEHINGFEGYVPEHGFPFKGEVTDKYNVRNTGKISFNPDHPFLQDAKDLIDIVDGRAVTKVAIPSPNLFFNDGTRNPDIYPTPEEYATDIIQTYQDAIKAFYDIGIRYLQLDEVYIAGLAADKVPWNDNRNKGYLIDLAVHVLKESLAEKPDDLTITVHLCRGNYRSTYAFSGGYDPVATKLFRIPNIDRFFLEYDVERSGDFQPLQHIPRGGARVVIGAVTSKSGKLEDQKAIIDKINQAAEYVPLDQLCLSPQCGFASTHHGN